MLIGTTPIADIITLTLTCDSKDVNDKPISLTTKSTPITGVYEFDSDPYVSLSTKISCKITTTETPSISPATKEVILE